MRNLTPKLGFALGFGGAEVSREQSVMLFAGAGLAMGIKSALGSHHADLPSEGWDAHRLRNVRRLMVLFFLAAFLSPQRSPTMMQVLAARVTAV